LTEWAAYYQLEPFGEALADRRHGIATSVLANVNRDAKARPEPYKPEDFIYWHQSHGEKAEHDGELLDDPAAQAKLLTDAFAALAVNVA
jgi:hypothetical protein